jgi:Skp family chaperone for outer membrane proteins
VDEHDPEALKIRQELHFQEIAFGNTEERITAALADPDNTLCPDQLFDKFTAEVIEKRLSRLDAQISESLHTLERDLEQRAAALADHGAPASSVSAEPSPSAYDKKTDDWRAKLAELQDWQKEIHQAQCIAEEEIEASTHTRIEAF